MQRIVDPILEKLSLGDHFLRLAQVVLAHAGLLFVFVDRAVSVQVQSFVSPAVRSLHL